MVVKQDFLDIIVQPASIYNLQHLIPFSFLVRKILKRALHFRDL